MRRLIVVSLFSLTLLPSLALAQTAPGAQPPGPSDMGYGPDHHAWKHGGWGHHGPDDAEMLMKFYAANTTHDGRLTQAQAQAAGLQPIVQNFSQIDTNHRGYVTFYDIQAWHLDDMAKHMEAQAAQLRAQD